MNPYIRVGWLIGVGLVLLLQGGCGAVIRSSIDTQPRVQLAADVIANPDEVVHGKAVAYIPGGASTGLDEDLVNYAPILVQGFQQDSANASYDYWSDGIGMPVGSDDGESIRIDTDQPIVFSRVEHASLYGSQLKQLTYVFWYPRRDVGSIETGEVDGGILRITLDAAGHPAIFEFSQTCGCYHGVFASSHIESLAKEEFGLPQAPLEHALESGKRHDEWIVRDVVDAQPGQRPVVYIAAGDHLCELIQFVDDGATFRIAQQKSYALNRYEQLSSIPTQSGATISMFNELQLVRGAKRWKEELMFMDMDHPVGRGTWMRCSCTGTTIAGPIPDCLKTTSACHTPLRRANTCSCLLIAI